MGAHGSRYLSSGRHPYQHALLSPTPTELLRPSLEQPSVDAFREFSDTIFRWGAELRWISEEHRHAG